MMPPFINRGHHRVRLLKCVSEGMDKLIERLAEALKQEFGHVLNADDSDGWQKAAEGIVAKMGLVNMQVNVTNPAGTQLRRFEAYFFEGEEF